MSGHCPMGLTSLQGPNDKDRAELKNLVEHHSDLFRRPNRGNLDDDTIKWRHGKPDYTKADLFYLKGKTQNHKPGSLEEVVENLVKTWESEASHKTDINQWVSISNPSDYTVSINGSPEMDGRFAKEIGNYNALMKQSKLYTELKEGIESDFEESHKLFRQAFEKGFAWEVLSVYTSPPSVFFSWRHWGEMTGTFNGIPGKGREVNLLGMCRATVDENCKVRKLEVFMDVDNFLRACKGELDEEMAESLVRRMYKEEIHAPN